MSLARFMSLPAIWIIRLYRATVSPAGVPCCRYHPTCSSYALEALKTRGLLVGGWLTLSRVCRCHPWGGQGFDPVPVPSRHSRSHTPQQEG